MNVFIDTNIFLNFYHYGKDDLDALDKVFTTHQHGSAKVYLTQQIYNEFMRNREIKLEDALKRFKDKRLPQLPIFMKQCDEYNKIIDLSKELDKLCKSLSANIDDKIKNNQLLADKLIENIFTKDVEPITPEYYQRAKMRMDLGNPPGKNGSLGDAINWCILLEKVPSGEDLHLISADGDFYSKLDEIEPNPVLLAEWKHQKSSNLYVYRELSKFLKENFDGVAFSYDKNKYELINSLYKVPNFTATHHIVAELEKFSYFSLSEVENILQAAKENGQFGRIVTDYDVSDFLNRIAVPRMSEIKDEKYLEILQNVVQEQEIRSKV